MDNVRKAILTEAIRRYGRGPQRDRAIEALSKLIRELARCDDPERIAEEIADARVMRDMLEIIFSNHEAVRIWELRLLHRMDKKLHVADEVV